MQPVFLKHENMLMWNHIINSLSMYCTHHQAVSENLRNTRKYQQNIGWHGAHKPMGHRVTLHVSDACTQPPPFNTCEKVKLSWTRFIHSLLHATHHLTWHSLHLIPVPKQSIESRETIVNFYMISDYKRRRKKIYTARWTPLSNPRTHAGPRVRK